MNTNTYTKKKINKQTQVKELFFSIKDLSGTHVLEEKLETKWQRREAQCRKFFF